MRKETIKIREKLVYDLWQEKKATLSMQDVADIFGLTIGNIYRIIKKLTKVENN